MISTASEMRILENGKKIEANGQKGVKAAAVRSPASEMVECVKLMCKCCVDRRSCSCLVECVKLMCKRCVDRRGCSCLVECVKLMCKSCVDRQ